MKPSSLEERLCNFVLDNPATIGGAVGIGALFCPMVEYMHYTPFTTIWPAYLTYSGLSALRDREAKKGYEQKTVEGNLFTRTKNFVFNHPRTSALIGGAIAASHYYAKMKHGIVFNVDCIPFTKGEHALYTVFPMSTIAIHLGITALKHCDMIKKSYTALREKTRGIKMPQDALNFFFEKPYIVGLPYGAYYSLSENVSGNMTPAFRAFDVGYQGALFTFAVAAAGGFLHTGSMSYHFNIAGSKLCKVLGNKKKAATMLKRAMTLPSSNAALLERKLTLADLLLDSEDEKEAIKEYREAAELFSKPENGMLSSPDLLRKMLFMKTGIENGFAPLAESMNEVVEYSPSPHARKRFVFKRGFDREHIEQEFNVNRAVSKIMAEEGFGGPFPPLSIACFPGIDGKLYHAMLRRNSQSLEDLFNVLIPKVKKNSEKAIDEFSFHMLMAINGMAKLHTNITRKMKEDENGCYLEYSDEYGEHRVNIPERDYVSDFSARVIKGKPCDTHHRLGLADYKRGSIPAVDKFIDSANEQLEVLEKDKIFFTHGDTAARHFLEDGTILDFESAGIGNPFVDLAQFLYSSPEPPFMFLPSYVRMIENRGYEFSDDVSEQLKSAFLFYSLCALGTSSGKLTSKRSAIDKFNGRMDAVFTIMDDLKLQEIKENFIEAMGYSALKHSNVIDYKDLMERLKKKI